MDITGRISMRLQNIDYDETSKIKPDSVNSEEYGKTSVIPGLQQSMNLSLFGRLQNFDFTLLSDIKNNDWNQFNFNNFNSVERISLNLRLLNHELVMGDFYQSGSERFLQSREIRGLKYSANFESILGNNTFLFFEGLLGQSQKAYNVGDRLFNIYKQFELTGQYKRFLGAGSLHFGKKGLFDVSLKYLQGEDDKSSIKESQNPALKNSIYGAQSDFYIWDKKIKVFADYFSSTKDTIDASKTDDFAWTSGLDVHIEKVKFIVLYRRIGFDYFTMGYPYLENDKQGLKSIAGFQISDALTLNADYELYENNLENDKFKPTAQTNILNTGMTINIKNYPEFIFNYGFRTDKSDKILNQDSLLMSTDKFNHKFGFKLAYKINRSRFSFSATTINLDDKSKIGVSQSSDSTQTSPLGTNQFITSFNFYSQASQYLFLSGGLVYSTLTLTNNQKNYNFYIYETNRWDIVPRKLKLESNLTAIFNDASNGGIQDYLSDYFQFNALISLEYFFTDFISLKILTGTDSRNYKYTTEEAMQVITNSDYGPTYFNGNETYNSWMVGGEFNYNF